MSSDNDRPNSKAEEFSWPPLESNPEIFTEYMHNVGLPKSYAIGEVFGFDEDLLAFIPQPIHATIVCCERLQKARDKQRGSESDANNVEYFMKQTGTLDNACGIIACIHATFNSNAKTEITRDSILGKFWNDTKDLTPMERCTSLETNDDFKTVHKGYASKGQSKEIKSDQSSVKCHFIAYVLQNGKLVELDGTRAGPYILGDCDDVLRGSISEVKRKLAEGEISESLNMMTLSNSNG
eukprot:CAMPEP_0172507542 /NCGR_PEP_ID=MMETSP1066-20121228/204408_1 /TAXON_ID=671091 /ORGANISM="Coscinodiscus wailesii, Strain CCMP2513" /LENGTH=237 /DNA_ID=CAMNT_0013285113 /DNA_START=85 /DNA_END=795 /DNA_ORIENTATION=-